MILSLRTDSVCTGLLLESWTSLLQRQERGSPEARAIGPELTACTAAAYQTLMDAYMRDLAAGATEDDDDEAAQVRLLTIYSCCPFTHAVHSLKCAT